MRIAFLDPIGWDYDPLTPLGRPLGGTQSAVAYLAAALARRGHEVAILNGAKAPRQIEGVTIAPIEGAPLARLAGLDAVILVSGLPLEALQSLWPLAQSKTPLLLWLHSNAETDAARYLTDGRVLASFDRIIGVSRWQAAALSRELGVPAGRIQPIGNAVAPPFEALLSAPPDQPRSPHPTLAYSVTPFRGLDLLLQAWPLILQAIPTAELKIYSSLAMYQVAEAEDPYREIYAACRATPSVDYVGALSQTDLAAALSQAWLFAYPSTYQETFCIGLIEAMAAGCHAVTTDLAALPETAMGHATLVPFEADRSALARRFADAAIDRLNWMAREPDSAAQARIAQRASLAQTMVWRTRALEWETMIASLRPAPATPQQPAPPAPPAPQNRVQAAAPNKLLVEGRHGRLLVDSRDAVGVIIARYGEWAEEELSRLMSLLRPGDGVIEVGAHVGSMTIGFARAVGPGGFVHAFEPQKTLFGLLCANVALNGLDQAQPVQALVGAEAGWRSLPAAAGAPGNLGAVSFVGESLTSVGRPGRAAQVTLDSWFAELDRLRLIKIDVEGMEAEVLAGGTALINRLRPIIQAECTTAEGFTALARFADAVNYDLYWNGCRGYAPTNFFGDRENLLGEMGDLNLLMLPRASGERLILPPAFAFEDAGAIHPGILGPGVWPRSDPPALPAPILPELIARGIGSSAVENDADFARFHQATESVRFLRQHRDLIEMRDFGFGERAFHAMWLELIRDRAAASPDRPLDLLEIGVFKGQVISLWALIGRLLRLPIAIDAMGPLSGEGPTDPAARAEAYRCGEGNIVPPDDYPALIADLFARCALDLSAIRFLRGMSQQPEIIAAAKPAYDLIYIDGDHAEAAVRADLANFAQRLRPGGFLVLDDAALFLEGGFWKGFEGPSRAAEDVPALGFKNLLNVGHNRVFQRS
jgi:FkbM family methyltransferase